MRAQTAQAGASAGVFLLADASNAPNGELPFGELSDTELPAGQPHNSGSPWKWTLIVSILSLAAFVARPYLVPSTHEGPLTLNATDKNGRVQMQWDPRSDVIQSAQGALLDVVDGTEVQRYPVDFKVLSSGALDYVRNTGEATLTLTLFRDGHPISQSVVRSTPPIPHEPARPLRR
jgi:hypothetical protein